MTLMKINLGEGKSCFHKKLIVSILTAMGILVSISGYADDGTFLGICKYNDANHSWYQCDTNPPSVSTTSDCENIIIHDLHSTSVRAYCLSRDQNHNGHWSSTPAG